MNSLTPPPMSHPNSARRVYVRAIAFLLPTVLAWLFAVGTLLPKVQMLWRDAGLATSATKAQWLMEYSSMFVHYAPLVFAGVVVFLLLFEALWSGWARYRSVVVACVTLLFHTAVLVQVTVLAITACLAAPALAKLK